MASITDILRPNTFTKTISRVSQASSWLLNFFGMQVGGANEAYKGHGREGYYLVFNHLRNVALETAPGAPAARRPRQAVGRVPFVYPRMHEEFSLLYEEIHNFGKIDDPVMRDIAGESYIRRQMIGPGERHANWRAACLVGMLRGSLYTHESGDYWYPSYDSSGSLVERPFQLPSGNKDQLDIADVGGTSIYGSAIIDASWDNPGADIPLHIQRVCAAIMRRNGVVIKHIMCRTELWNQIINNERIAALAGFANQPFELFERQVGTNPDGSPMMVHTGRVGATPGITYWINDDGRELGIPGSETFTYDIEEGHALFLPDPNPNLFEMLIGSEPIVERDGSPAVVKTGFAAWNNLVSNPSSYESFILDNALPVPYVPGCWAYADCVF